MDTRRKINAGPPPDALIVSGYFDPLLAEHAARLLAARIPGRPLAVLILDSPRPILGARARAELVAALSCVDDVILPSELDEPVPTPHLHMELEDTRATDRFVAHVRERQS